MDQDKIHAEILQDAIADAHQNPERQPPHRIWVILAFIVALAVVLAFAGGGSLIEFLTGRLHSHTIDNDYAIQLGDGKAVYMTREVYALLVELWSAHQTEEFAVCLIGKKRGFHYDVTDAYLPTTFSADVRSVTFAGCSKDTLITLHSHPQDRCIQSEQDRITHALLQQDNPDAISALMCGPGRFTFLGEQI